MSTTLNLYWDLSSAKADKRIHASSQLVTALCNFQQQAKLSTSEDSSANVEALLQEKCAEDVSYAIKRLTRGLGSRRESSRIGFSVALTEVLASLPFFTVKAFTELLLSSTQIGSGMKRDEEKDMLFGRLFGIHAIVKAQMLGRPSTTIEDFQLMIESLQELSDKKIWLSEPCWWIASQTLSVLQDVTWKQDAIQILVKKVDALEIWRPEMIPFTMRLMSIAPDQKWQAILSPTWKNGNPLHQKNLPTLAAVLKESSAEDNEVGQTGSWTPQLNHAWTYIMTAVLTDLKPLQISIQDFWQASVEESLFAPNSTHERKYWGFLVFEELLPQLPVADVPMIFTPNFLKTLMNQLADQDRYLNKAAKKVVEVIQHAAEENKTVASSLAAHLLGQQGYQNFDRLSRSKLVENLVASMDATGVDTYVDYLKEQFFTPSTDDVHHASLRRRWAVDQMVALVRNGKIAKGSKWLHKVLQLFVVVGFFEIEKTKSLKSELYELKTIASPEISEEIQELCRIRLQTLLGELMAQNKGVDDKNDLWTHSAVQLFNTLEKTKGVKSLIEFDESEAAARVSANATISKLHGHAKSSEQLQALEILFEYGFVMMYYEPETAMSTLDELHQCYEKMNSKKSKSPKKDEPQPVDVIIDILISFLSQPSAALRTLCEQVFGKICNQMTQASLDIMIDILQRSSNEETEEIFEDDDMMDLDEEASEEEEQEIDASSNDASDDEADSDADEDEDVDEEFKAKLEAALGDAANAEGESSEEELLDDEQMMQFDEKLAELFRERKAQQTSKRTAREDLLNLKLKIFGLLVIFVKRNPDDPLVLELIAPLVQVMREQVSTPSVYQGAKSLSSTIVKRKSSKTFEERQTLQTLDALVDVMKQSSSVDLSNVCSALAFMLVKSVIKTNMDVSSPGAKHIIDLYQTAAKEFLTAKKATVEYKAFADLTHRYPMLGWQLTPTILDCLSNGNVSKFKKVKALSLLAEIITHIQSAEYQVLRPDIISSIAPMGKEFSVILRDNSLNADRLKDVLRSIITMVRITLKIDWSAASEQWLKDRQWVSAVQSILNTERFKQSQAVQSSGKQILKLLTDSPPSNVASLKRKADDVDEGADSISVAKPEIDRPQKAKKVKSKVKANGKASKTVQ